MQAYFDDFGKYGLVARHCNCIFGGFLIFKGVPKILKKSCITGIYTKN